MKEMCLQQVDASHFQHFASLIIAHFSDRRTLFFLFLQNFLEAESILPSLPYDRTEGQKKEGKTAVGSALQDVSLLQIFTMAFLNDIVGKGLAPPVR